MAHYGMQYSPYLDNNITSPEDLMDVVEDTAKECIFK